MNSEKKLQGSDLFIVDNSDSDWKVKNYLHEWTDLAHKFDIATGYFEIGSLLALDGQWQKLEKIRILMGDEVSKRTKRALLAGVETAKQILDSSIDKEKEKMIFSAVFRQLLKQSEKTRLSVAFTQKINFTPRLT